VESTNKDGLANDFLEKIAFQKLKNLLAENAGLNCEGYRDEYLRRRFDIRLRATNTGTFSKYLAYLKRTPDEYQLLLNDLTVNFTMFFRDPDVFTFLEKRVLPKLLESGSVRIWSAGCATGEEPYSLAILVHRLVTERKSGAHVTIYASDIDKDALQKAAVGEYQLKQLQNLDSKSIDAFFTKKGELYQVKDCIKAFMRFEQRDLMKLPAHQNLDLILCRNVMIYFSKEGQQKIHMQFFEALRDGGYFITGKAEMLSGEPSRRFVPLDIRARVYQKTLTTSSCGQTNNLELNVSTTPLNKNSF
jgi:chemotaxis protein methyltransferase CheR